MQKVAGIKSWIADFESAATKVEEVVMMPDFIAEGLASEVELDEAYAVAVEAVEALELRNMLRGEAPMKNMRPVGGSAVTPRFWETARSLFLILPVLTSPA